MPECHFRLTYKGSSSFPHGLERRIFQTGAFQPSEVSLCPTINRTALSPNLRMSSSPSRRPRARLTPTSPRRSARSTRSSPRAANPASTDAPPTTPTPGAAERAPSNWNIANGLTVLRIVLVPVFLWLLLRHGGQDLAERWWAFGVFVLAMITDRIDGDLARKYGLITDFGKIADPIADKALTGAAFISLSAIGELWWWVTIVVLVREIGITLMRFVVIKYGVMPASKGGKLKTALQALALALLLMPLGGFVYWIGCAVMGAAVVVTVATGVDYVLAARRLVRESTAGAGTGRDTGIDTGAATDTGTGTGTGTDTRG